MSQLVAFSELENIIISTIYGNNNREITGDQLQQVLLYILYSLKHKSEPLTSSPFTILPTNLNAQNKVVHTHNLNAQVIGIIMVNHNNEIVFQPSYTATIINNNQTEIFIPGGIPSGEWKVRYYLISTEEIPGQELQRTISETFNLFQGIAPNEYNPGWSVSTDASGGITNTHLVRKPAGGLPGVEFYSELPSLSNANKLIYTSNVFLLNNTDYKMTIKFIATNPFILEYFTNSGVDDYRDSIFEEPDGTEETTVRFFTTGANHPQDTQPFYFQLKRESAGGGNLGVRITSLKIELN